MSLAGERRTALVASQRRLRLLRRLDLGGLALALATLIFALIWAFPLYFAMATTMLPQPGEVTGSWLLDFGRTLGRYGGALFGTEIGRWYINSIVTSSAVTVGVLFISAT